MASPVNASDGISKIQAAPPMYVFSLIEATLKPSLLPALIEIIKEYAKTWNRYMERPLFREQLLLPPKELASYECVANSFYTNASHQLVTVRSCLLWDWNYSRSAVFLTPLDSPEPKAVKRDPTSIYPAHVLGEFLPHHSVLHDGGNEFAFLYLGRDYNRLDLKIERRFPNSDRLKCVCTHFFLPEERTDIPFVLRSAAYDQPTHSFLILTSKTLLFYAIGSAYVLEIPPLPRHPLHFVTGIGYNRLLAVGVGGSYFIDHFRDPKTRKYLHRRPEGETYHHTTITPNRTTLFVLAKKTTAPQANIKEFALPNMECRREFPLENPSTWREVSFIVDDSTLIVSRKERCELHFWDLASGDHLSVFVFVGRRFRNGVHLSLHNSMLIFSCINGCWIYDFQKSSTKEPDKVALPASS